jgi:hypothetical protein
MRQDEENFTVDDHQYEVVEDHDDNFQEYPSASEQTKLMKKRVRKITTSLRQTGRVIGSTIQKTQVPDEEVVNLTPWEKFRKYYQIPWLIFLDFISIVCVVTLVFFFY